MSHLLDELILAQKRGEPRGLPSICSAHPWVLKAAMLNTLNVSKTYGVLLVESTSNQVNQFGGYTGMTPADFANYLRGLAEQNNFPPERLVLGGDHLGPSPWQKEPAASAMQKAEELVRTCVLAGYTKIHIDASMRLGDDDPTRPLDLALAARRTADLVNAVEQALAVAGRSSAEVRYVIGSEVPQPGGASEAEKRLHVTRVEDARLSLEAMQTAFRSQGVQAAWERVIALVVQPGVEFGSDYVLQYDPNQAQPLRRFAETIPFVYEAHSTDYQTVDALRSLVRDHFAILKVGPALTFAFREMVFALAGMEDALIPAPERSRLVETIEAAMLRNPSHWEGHYHGSAEQQAFARKHSLSDRIRYYWSVPEVQAAFGHLFQNLGEKPLPVNLISRFMPVQLEKVRLGSIANTAEAFVLDKVRDVLKGYSSACGQEIGQ